MNHFAHLVLSQPTVESTVGNLLGDFARGIDQSRLPAAILAGLLNHRAVDRFTDNHPSVIDLKRRFSPQRRRFAGIALDIYFDHLLIDNWSLFKLGDLKKVIASFYTRIESGQIIMPSRHMQLTTTRMVDYDWFGSYGSVRSISTTLDQVAGRIRFENDFDNAIEDLLNIQVEIKDAFIEFFPQLKRHIKDLAIENCLQIQ